MDDSTFRALQEQSMLLDELAKHPGWDVLTDYAAQQVAAPKWRQLIQGAAKTYPEYQNIVGFVRGADRVVGIPDEVRAQLNAEIGRRHDVGEAVS